MEVESKKPEDTELDIKRAMRARVKDFKEQADSLTLEGVRRALEKDLGMKTFSLDVHKRFIKQCLEECFYGGDDADLSTTTGSAPDPHPSHVSKETPSEKDEPQQPKDLISVGSEINEGAVEFLSVEEKPNHESIKDDGIKHDEQPSEDTIKKAIEKRAFFFRSNLEKITLAKVRRLLEEDLNLQKNTLDAYKSFISNVLDEVLQSPESAETTNGTKKKPKKVLKNKETGKVKREPKVVSEDLGSSDLGNDASEADEDSDVFVKRLKKRPLKKSKSSVEPIKKQKKSSDANIMSVSRKKRREEIGSEIGAESDNERSSENGGSHSSSDERPKKKQEKPTTQTYGKHVEHLKSVIKACGMGVPPAVYKRAKQVSDSKREAFVIKELEDILAKEGLSTNPSDKEIKSVKRKKERARELEGIDMSNIVSTSRRRSSINYIPTPKQKTEVESDEDEEDEAEEDEDDQEGTDEGEDVCEASSEGLEEDAEAEADADEEEDGE